MTLSDLLPPELAARLDTLDVLSRKVFAGKLQGERRSKRRGKSVEFEEHREYVPGDDLRHIDWNVFARLDRFFIKIFEEEEDLGLHLVLDSSPSMVAGAPTKLLTAARLAIALGYVGLVRNNRVSLTVLGGPGGAARRLAPLRGRRNVQRLARFLLEQAFAPQPHDPDRSPGETRGGPGAEFEKGMRAVAAAREGKGVLVLLSDLLIPPPEGYQRGLRLLAAPGGGAGGGAGMGGAGVGGGGGGGGGGSRDSAFEVYVLQVLSPGELDPTQEGRATAQPGAELDTDLPGQVLGDLALADVETGRVAEVTVTLDLLERYRRAVKAYVGEIAGFCAARGMTHLLVASDADISTMVIDTLRRRGLLG